MFKFLKDRIDFWLLIITLVMVPIIAFLMGINFRVEALEKKSLVFDDFIKTHIEQQAQENAQLQVMQQSLKLLTGYFKLTPKE